MTAYRRLYLPGMSWFFTVNLEHRQGKTLLVDRIDDLRAAFAKVKARHPFRLEAWVMMPDHLHCIWTLPQGDADYASRWSLIKAGFSRAIAATEPRSASRQSRRERGIWQRRFWEHGLRDDEDFQRHLDYIHRNPLKHGLVQRVQDWPHSSFHAYVARGIYPLDWCGDADEDIRCGDFEEGG